MDEQQTAPVFDVNTKHLIGASGKKYIVQNTLNAEEFKTLEVLRIEIEIGNSVDDLIKMQGKAIGFLQKNDVYGASVALYNGTNIAERIREGRDPAWLLCLTLFARPEGFAGKWTEGDAAEWIADWTNYGVHDLFTLAITCKAAFDSAFTLASQAILSEQKSDADGSEQSEAKEAASR